MLTTTTMLMQLSRSSLAEAGQTTVHAPDEAHASRELRTGVSQTSLLLKLAFIVLLVQCCSKNSLAGVGREERKNFWHSSSIEDIKR